jgi:hypothetical protein
LEQNKKTALKRTASLCCPWGKPVQKLLKKTKKNAKKIKKKSKKNSKKIQEKVETLQLWFVQ